MRTRGRRGAGEQKHENSERWLLTYCDLITLLCAFFIVMYGMSNADVQKFTKLAGSMRKAFNVMDASTGGAQPGVFDTSTSLLPESNSGDGEGALMGKEDALEAITQEMGAMMEQEGMSDKVSVSVREEGVSISISGNLLFASGRAELRPESQELLHALGKTLSKFSNDVRIEGHTDDVRPSGTEYPTNWELSAARGVAVVRYLVEAEGISPERLSAAAFSQYQPVASNGDPRSRGKNRRSEILILSGSRSSAANGGTPGPQASGAKEGPIVQITR